MSACFFLINLVLFLFFVFFGFSSLICRASGREHKVNRGKDFFLFLSLQDELDSSGVSGHTLGVEFLMYVICI